MKIRWFVVFLLVLSLHSVAQDKNLKVVETVTVDGKLFLLHEVEQGETLFSICKKYGIEQKELIGANPQLIFGLKQGDKLKILATETLNVAEDKPVTKNEEDQKFIYHVVKKSETIYSISKEYNVPVKNIFRYNPEAENDVLENEIIRIPKFEVKTEEDGLVRQDAEYYYHKVQPQENLYALSRKYDVPVSSILKYNPDVANRFDIGTIVRIPKFKEEPQQVSVDVTGEYFYHTIETGDTFYSYQRRFGVSRKMLVDLNPELNDGFQIGLRIKIPSTQIEKVEVVPLQPDKFINHIVKQGETLYAISRQYDVKVMDIKKLNPELKTRGLIAGETVYIAKDELNKNNVSKSEEIVADQLKPEEKKNESPLPEVMFKYEEEKQPECKKTFSVSKNDTFRIAMFLPLYFDKNDSLNVERISDREWQVLDSLKATDPSILKKYFKVVLDSVSMRSDTILIDSLGVKQIRTLYRPSRVAVSFYQGVLIALDSMQRAGARIRLDLYDTEHGVPEINRILNQPDFVNTDLIVGPVDTTLQKNVSSFSAKNRIPMISPFSICQTLLNNNPYYFQTSPSKKYMLRKTADYIADEYYDKNFLVINMSKTNQQSESEMVKMVRDKFFSRKLLNSSSDVKFTQVDFIGSEGYWQVKNTLRKDVENVVFIPTTDNRSEREALLSRAVNSLNVLAEEYDITLIGVLDYPFFRSIKTEYFHKLKLHFLTPNYIDYNSPDVNSFIRKFRADFNSEPDYYSFRGYDIISYFVGAYEAFGKNFSDCIGNYENRSLQCDFNFQKVQKLGGYMNHSLYILNYTPDYLINVVTEVTEGRTLKN